jgi:hypothetical protein
LDDRMYEKPVVSRNAHADRGAGSINRACGSNPSRLGMTRGHRRRELALMLLGPEAARDFGWNVPPIVGLTDGVKRAPALEKDRRHSPEARLPHRRTAVASDRPSGCEG